MTRSTVEIAACPHSADETSKGEQVLRRKDAGPDRPRICLVAHFAYGALAGLPSSHIGGVEKQTSFMARWLADRGYRVSMITWASGQPDGAEVHGVRVYSLCQREDGLPGLRFLHPRWTSLRRALVRANADVYYHNCAEHVTGQVAWWCRRHHRRFVYSVANDTEVDASLPDLFKLRDRCLYRYGLRHADCVVVQTSRQQQRLQHDFGLSSVVIPMPCPAPDAESRGRKRGKPERVLWMARLSRQKRPDRLVEIARICPHLQFDLVGPAVQEGYSDEVIRQARALPNVVVHGGVPRDRVNALYAGAALLCNTSDFDGFPNTFLEAWSHGIPVVSTFDPDQLIEKHGLGKIACSVEGLSRAINELLGDEACYMRASGRARQYYEQNHDPAVVMPRFEQVFLRVCGSKQG